MACGLHHWATKDPTHLYPYMAISLQLFAHDPSTAAAKKNPKEGFPVHGGTCGIADLHRFCSVPSHSSNHTKVF